VRRHAKISRLRSVKGSCFVLCCCETFALAARRSPYRTSWSVPRYPAYFNMHYINFSKAPVVKKRTTARAKSARASRPQITLPSPDSTSSLFPASKRDKRTIKHSSFVSKIEKTSKVQKRRRPNKKLVANLESLANALPGLDDETDNGKSEVVLGQAKIHRKSLKSRPGAMKRKSKLEKLEMERFNANLAQMVGTSRGQSDAERSNSIADRWAALKNHVQNTTEVKPEFVKK
jgi:hypothetical protein